MLTIGLAVFAAFLLGLRAGLAIGYRAATKQSKAARWLVGVCAGQAGEKARRTEE